MEQAKADKKIAEIEECLYHYTWVCSSPQDEFSKESIEWLIDQLKECREEIIITKLIETRLRKSWKEDTESATKRGDHKCAQIEQRTKEACMEACRQKVVKQIETDGLYLYEIQQAIDSAEVK